MLLLGLLVPHAHAQAELAQRVLLERIRLNLAHHPALIPQRSNAGFTQQIVIPRLTQGQVALGLYVVFHQFDQPLAEPGAAQIAGAYPLMTDHPIAIHVLCIIDAEVANIVKERRQHHLVVTALIQRQLRGLGHMLNLRHRLANVIVSAVLLIQTKNLFNHLLCACHHISSSIRAILPSAIAGPTLMPTPVCISAAFKPGATSSQVKGLAPFAP